jgi:hypothetical protein
MRNLTGPIALLLFPAVAAAQVPLGPEFRVNTYTTDRQLYPSVARHPSGNFVVTWTSLQDGQSYGVFGQRYDDAGTPLGPEFRVNSYTTSRQDWPSVAGDSSGNFVVVWDSQDEDGSDTGVFGQRYASTGAAVGPEFRVNTYVTGEQTLPSIAVDASGGFVVVWQSFPQDSGQWNVFGQRYATSGTPLGPEFRVNTYPQASYTGGAAVASEMSGNFVVVWHSALDGGGLGVFGRRYSATGVTLGAEFRVNTYTTGNQRYPSIASDATGNFIVVWDSDQDGDGYGIFGQRYASTGAAVGPEFRINTWTTSRQDFPSVALDSSGNFVVVWNSYAEDGSNWGIFGQRYGSSGAPIGTEFRVNTFTPSYQVDPVVAADAAGNFVVVWDSPIQDGSSFGVFGQRYAQIVPVELMHFRVD